MEKVIFWNQSAYKDFGVVNKNCGLLVICLSTDAV